jgi:hypothetical protein
MVESKQAKGNPRRKIIGRAMGHLTEVLTLGLQL